MVIMITKMINKTHITWFQVSWTVSASVPSLAYSLNICQFRASARPHISQTIRICIRPTLVRLSIIETFNWWKNYFFLFFFTLALCTCCRRALSGDSASSFTQNALMSETYSSYTCSKTTEILCSLIRTAVTFVTCVSVGGCACVSAHCHRHCCKVFLFFHYDGASHPQKPLDGRRRGWGGGGGRDWGRIARPSAPTGRKDWRDRTSWAATCRQKP